MKLDKVITSLFATALLSTTAFAGGSIEVEPDVVLEPIETAQVLEPTFYVGIGGVATGLSRECGCGDDDERLKDMTYGVILKAGADITDNFGVEARYINSSIENDFSELVHYGLYLKPQYMVNEDTKLYGLLGYGKTEIDFTVGTRLSTLDVSGFSFGVGAEYALENNLGLWVDMQNIFSGKGVFNTDVNLGSFGVMYNF